MRMLVYILVILLLSVIMLVFGALWLNRAPLWQSPGVLPRLTIYLTTNSAQTSDNPRLPELRTPHFPVDAATLYGLVLRQISRLGWRLGAHESATDTLHAVVTTSMWGFKDDVEITVHAAGKDASSLSIRSQSRVGRGDLGANRRHVRDLLDALDQVLVKKKN